VRFNDEVDVVVAGTRTANALARLFLADIRRARLIDTGGWERRPWRQRGLELFWKPWENLL
jgi:phosphatidylserine/phosphatidylglycerophosphate/cardiolipin synthase-like enzyme